MSGLDKFRIVVASIILGVWVSLLVVSSIDPSRRVDPEVHLIMTAVAGFLFGGPLLKRNGAGARHDG